VGVRGNNESRKQAPMFNPMEPTPAIESQPYVFKKKANIKEDSFI
jgi:hypothetical protein